MPSSVPPSAFLYADYGCPHSLIAHGRMARLASEGLVVVSIRPLPGREAPVDEPFREAIRDLSRKAAELGYALSVPPVRPDTHDACRAAEFARDCGRSFLDRLNDVLFRAVLCEGVDVGKRSELLEVAGRTGLDGAGLERALDDDRYDRALAETESEAERYGVTATPTMLIGRFKLVGAAPEEVLRETIVRAGGRDDPPGH